MRNDDRSYKHLAHLVKRAQQGDAEAFRELYERTAQAQYFNVAAKVGYATADDILQEAYLVAWKNLADIRPRAFIGYVRRVADTLCLQYFERGSHPRETSTDTDDFAVMDTSAKLHGSDPDKGDPAPEVGRRDATRRLAQALREELDERERETLLLRFYQDMKIDEIAETLEVSPSTVKRTIRGALDKLREKLGVLPTGVVFAAALQRAVEDPLATGVSPKPAPSRASWADRAVPAVAALAVIGAIGCVAVAAGLPREAPAAPVDESQVTAEPAPDPTLAPEAGDTAAPELASMVTERGGAVLAFTDESAVAEVRLTDEAGATYTPAEADTADPTHPVFRFQVPSGTYQLRATDAVGNAASGEITVTLPPEEPVSVAE
ncbi:MAG: sigma-70 family RNA polymerase sigma factor [Adlercreutzia sp.]|nr:sigma-70 family RNA polymerase sigma factor [Adlercreutzia sp.]